MPLSLDTLSVYHVWLKCECESNHDSDLRKADRETAPAGRAH